jgi:hypothetical protein
LNQYLMDQ